MNHPSAGDEEAVTPFSVSNSAKSDSPAVMRKAGQATDHTPPTR
jgi:hypothetical protein